jgi:hypothetical protein
MINERLQTALASCDPIKSGWPWHMAFRSAKRRSKSHNLSFTINDDWARERYTGKCELSGIPFEFGRKRSPYLLSIDQIRPKAGYTPDNCRFILWSINAMLGACGEDQHLLTIARGIVKNQLQIIK